MDQNNAVEIRHVSKIYSTYAKEFDRFREALSPKRKSYHKDFVALKDVNLTVRKGECVGIIGTNGSGKSTLLKIITGVLHQTGGEIEIDGHISSLLELGAGFNPNYTGMENIYLNGQIMGSPDEEIKKRVPLIEEFADIGDFIHYAEVLLDHLEEDNGSEPFIYDKIVNTPFLGGMHIGGFNYLSSVDRTSLRLITRPDSDYYSITLIRDPENPEEYGSWEDMGDMRSCKEDYGSQKLYFTVDGVSYLCSFQSKTGKYADFASSSDLLDFIRENCYVR